MLQKLSLPLLLLFLCALSALLWVYGISPSLQSTPIPLVVEEQHPPDIAAASPSSEIARLKPIRITFLGDMMFDRHVRTKAEAAGDYNFVLSEAEQLWQESDLVVGNLEAPITDSKSVSQGSEVGSANNYIFTTDPLILDVLKQYPFAAVLGNNHIFNFGTEGIIQTEEYLQSAGIPYFGQTGYEHSPASAVIEIDGLRFALINYNQFITGGEPQAFADLKTLSETTDLQIIYTHWGIEYEPTARPVVVDLARRFVDAGADLIIGSHPHVIQNSEIYRGAPIYYSLGNFVFDQYFSEEVRTGLVVTAVIDPETLAVDTEENQVRIETSGQTIPINAINNNNSPNE